MKSGRFLYYWLAKAGRWAERQQVNLMMKHGLNSYQPDPFGIVTAVTVDRDEQGTFEKWSLLEARLPKEPYTALDIGCNIGFFSFKMAMSGADHVLGFDTERGPLLVAEKLKTLGRVGNVGFCTHRVTRENVELLGAYDVILFLSVFHHLVYAYDMETAKAILKILILRARKVMFFETGQGDQGFGRMASSMPAMDETESQAFIEDLLYECGANAVEKIGDSNLKNGKKRSLYKVLP